MKSRTTDGGACCVASETVSRLPGRGLRPHARGRARARRRSPTSILRSPEPVVRRVPARVLRLRRVRRQAGRHPLHDERHAGRAGAAAAPELRHPEPAPAAEGRLLARAHHGRVGARRSPSRSASGWRASRRRSSEYVARSPLVQGREVGRRGRLPRARARATSTTSRSRRRTATRRGGFINHNSYWHSKIMTEKALHGVRDHRLRRRTTPGVLATAPGRLNPYKLGLELFRNIEDALEQGAVRQGVGGVRLPGRQARLGPAARARAARRSSRCAGSTTTSPSSTSSSPSSSAWSRSSTRSASTSGRATGRSMTPRVQEGEGAAAQGADQPRPAVHLRRGRQLQQPRRAAAAPQPRGRRSRPRPGRATRCTTCSRVWTRPVSILTRVDSKAKLLRWDEGGYSDKSA